MGSKNSVICEQVDTLNLCLKFTNREISNAFIYAYEDDNKYVVGKLLKDYAHCLKYIDVHSKYDGSIINYLVGKKDIANVRQTINIGIYDCHLRRTFNFCFRNHQFDLCLKLLAIYHKELYFLNDRMFIGTNHFYGQYFKMCEKYAEKMCEETSLNDEFIDLFIKIIEVNILVRPLYSCVAYYICHLDNDTLIIRMLQNKHIWKQMIDLKIVAFMLNSSIRLKYYEIFNYIMSTAPDETYVDIIHNNILTHLISLNDDTKFNKYLNMIDYSVDNHKLDLIVFNNFNNKLSDDKLLKLIKNDIFWEFMVDHKLICTYVYNHIANAEAILEKLAETDPEYKLDNPYCNYILKELHKNGFNTAYKLYTNLLIYNYINNHDKDFREVFFSEMLKYLEANCLLNNTDIVEQIIKTFRFEEKSVLKIYKECCSPEVKALFHLYYNMNDLGYLIDKFGDKILEIDLVKKSLNV